MRGGRTHWWKEMPRSRLRPVSRAVQPSAEQLRVMAAAAAPAAARAPPSARPLATAGARAPCRRLAIGRRARRTAAPLGAVAAAGAGAARANRERRRRRRSQWRGAILSANGSRASRPYL